MAGLTISQKKAWAKTLYISENLTQKEVSEKVGVSKVTLNKWVNDPDDNWERLKKSMLITREAQLSRLYMQLDELNTTIMSRESGKKFADYKEADIIGKLTNAIKSLEIEASIADIVEVSKRQLSWMRSYNPDKAKEFAPILDDFIKHCLKTR